MKTMKLAYRPSGFRSNAGFVADVGKYRFPEEDDDMAQVQHGEADDSLLVMGLRACIESGQRILTVGSPPGTFPDKLQRDPFLLFWPSSEASPKDASRIIPAEVGAVLLTNMLSHDLSRNVRHQVRTRSLLCPNATMSPGAAKRVLMEIAQRSEPMPPQKVTALVPQQKAPEPAPAVKKLETADAVADLQRLIEETASRAQEVIAGLQLISESVANLAGEVALAKVHADTLKGLRDLIFK